MPLCTRLRMVAHPTTVRTLDGVQSVDCHGGEANQAPPHGTYEHFRQVWEATNGGVNPSRDNARHWWAPGDTRGVRCPPPKSKSLNCTFGRSTIQATFYTVRDKEDRLASDRIDRRGAATVIETGTRGILWSDGG